MGDAARKDVTKKVRMSREEAERLASLAKRTERSESEVIREALQVLEEYEAQRDALGGLISMVRPDEDYTKQEIWLE